MAELVDALASGASVLAGVEVRVFSWAPNLLVAALLIHPNCPGGGIGRRASFRC
nr:MAG TPA: hypothetical protein [Bacteriophage sp.]